MSISTDTVSVNNLGSSVHQVPVDMDETIPEAPDSPGGFKKTEYINDVTIIRSSSIKAEKIAASSLFGSIAIAGGAIAGTAPLDLASFSIIIGVTAICAIASVIFGYTAHEETIQHRTFDFRPPLDANPKVPVHVDGRDILIDKIFRDDCTRSGAHYLIKMPHGTFSIREIYSEEFQKYEAALKSIRAEYEPKIQLAKDDEELKNKLQRERSVLENAEEEKLQNAISTQFVSYLVKELGPDREHLILEITHLFSQNAEIPLQGMKNTLGSHIFSKREKTPTGVFLYLDESDFIPTLEIPKEGPVTIVSQIKGDIKRKVTVMGDADVCSYILRRPFKGVDIITVGSDRWHHSDSRISLTI